MVRKRWIVAMLIALVGLVPVGLAQAAAPTSVSVGGGQYQPVLFNGLTAQGLVYVGADTQLNSTAAPTNGQILIGNTGGSPALGTLTGTANQITVTNAANSITLSIPSTPVFTGLQLQGGQLQLGTSGNTHITDWRGLDFLRQISTASAVNGLTLTNGATTTPPQLGCGGTSPDANCGLRVNLSGTGTFQVASAANQGAHIELRNSNIPTVSAGSVTTGSTDVSGQITATAVTSVTLTFATPWTNQPFCTATDATTATAVWIPSALQKTTSFNIQGFPASDVLNYVCIGRF